jgi:adenylate cyclase
MDRSLIVGIAYGLLMSLMLGGIELFVMEGPMLVWLSGLSFTTNLIIRSAIYAAIIIILQWSEVGEAIAGLPRATSSKTFWYGFIYSALISVLFNLVLGIANLIGGRTLLNFITGRYHTPVEENRFVLFVDIAGSTGLAEQLGGIGIHRLLDHTFRLLTLSVVDYRGEVLNYVGDEVIVTWPELSGSVDCRPLRCFASMRDELTSASRQLKREFVGEIGYIKRAIVFNGDVMNTAARLEELSRGVEGGFLASRAAMEQFRSALPVKVRNLGRLPIRGRADGIDVVGLDIPTAQAV